MTTADFGNVASEINKQIGPRFLHNYNPLLRRYMLEEGLGEHHVEAYDNWIQRFAASNITGQHQIVLPNHNFVRLENVQLQQPRYSRDGKSLPLTPKLAREQGITYGSDWYVNVVAYSEKDGIRKKESEITNVCLCNIPVMIKSSYCYLRGKTPYELALMGEDPSDPAGYFIIKGAERFVLLQEQLATNRIILMQETDQKKKTAKSSKNMQPIIVKMTIDTPRGTVIAELGAGDGNVLEMRFRLPQVKLDKDKTYTSINVLVIFRLLGISDIEEIKKRIETFLPVDPSRRKKALLKLTNNLADLLIYNDDLRQFYDKVFNVKNSAGLSEEMINSEVYNVLTFNMLPHLNDLPGINGENENQRKERVVNAKLELLSIMIARYLEYQAGFRQLNDRDSWSIKRARGAGSMMEPLLRTALRTTLKEIVHGINTGAIRDLAGVAEKLRQSIITETFESSFNTGNWGVKGAQTKPNVARILARDSVLATLADINTLDVSASRTTQQTSLRLVQNSQWGFVCPVSTPEGENTGLVKNLAILAKVSMERKDDVILRRLLGDEKMGLKKLVRNEPGKESTDKVMVNGKFIGWCNGEAVRNELVFARRSGELYYDMSVIREGDWLYVDTGPSRLIRPLLIVAPDQSGLMIDKIPGMRDASIAKMRSSGVLEYMSAWEQEYIKIASTPDLIAKRLAKIAKDAENLRRVQRGEKVRKIESNSVFDDNKSLDDPQNFLTLEEATLLAEESAKSVPYTHCELDPKAILGIAAVLIPWPNHNPAARNTFQVSMGKQALGIYHANHKQRFDGKTKTLAYCNRPIVETEVFEIIGLDKRGPGQNITIAFLSLPGNEEDSFVVKKEFLDNGGFRIVKYMVYETKVKQSGDIVEELAMPVLAPGESLERYAALHGNETGVMKGLPKIGAFLNHGDCVIGKNQKRTDTKEVKNASVFMNVGGEGSGIVDSVLVTSDSKHIVVQVKMRIMRVPQVGDKFSPRNSQKGTIGVVKNAADLPFDENGIVPDFIVNAASIPSRMTSSYFMEMLASKFAALKGVQINGGAFQPFERNMYSNVLKQYGYNEFGYEITRSGTSGKIMDGNIVNGVVKANVFMCPMYFQALKHHVKDKIQVRATGQVRSQSRQPSKGKRVRGGLRYGMFRCKTAICTKKLPLWWIKPLQVSVI